MQSSTVAVKSGMLGTHGTDCLTVNRHSAGMDKQAGPRHPLRQNCSTGCKHSPAPGQLSHRRCDPDLGPTGIPGTRHWAHEAPCPAYCTSPLAGKCGNWVLGPDMLCPRALRLAGVWVGSYCRTSAVPWGSVPLPCAGSHSPGHQQRQAG